MIVLKNRSRRWIALALCLVAVCAVLAMGAGALEVSVEDTYSTGEVVLIQIASDAAINPADYAVEITKPNGEIVTTTPRQEKWNGTTGCFETYTIEMLGDYDILVTGADGSSAETTFTANVWSMDSIIFTIVSVVVFALSVVVYVIQKKKTA